MRVRETRKGFVFILMVMIHIVSWVGATSRPIASSHVSFHPEITSPQAAEHNSKRPMLVPNENKEIKEEMEKRRRIGSKPPSCDKKCYGCEPCEAIQVPTISSIPHLSPHYANYQPEGWRCHCAP
ncbi:EPIDERMAL PATTERNING FACTOR-like protein 3 [Arabidopsis lyrata subsp. lyrata]|nr:EPIDERMAL PATTERNING FACTOR-like protein 3 [Arabidopsis lyrata subsp. lyrata]|eukprot:XP_002882858.2 EPIDERMAL PATTERNING FACTOR-like protein 3 [Arabidopsis lyrata subsp. lyrata]